jgi:hypothetical protein
VGNGGLFLPIRQPPMDEAGCTTRIRRPLALAPLAGGRSLSGSASAPVLKARSAAAAAPARPSDSHIRRCAHTNGPESPGAETSSTRLPRFPPSARSPELESLKTRLAADAPDVIGAMSLRSPAYYGNSPLQQRHGAPTQGHEDFDKAGSSGSFATRSPHTKRRGGADQARGLLSDAIATAAVHTGTSAAHPEQNLPECSPETGHVRAPPELGDGFKFSNLSRGHRALDLRPATATGWRRLSCRSRAVEGHSVP